MADEQHEKQLIDEFKKGSREAADQLIQLYFDRVVKSADKKLAKRNLRVGGGDDVAVSVFDSLWKKASEQEFAEGDLASPDELWRLLSKMVAFKAEDHARRLKAQKRGGGNVRGDSIFFNPDQPSPGFNGVAGNVLTPAEKLELQESYTLLMKVLDDEVLQKVAVMRIEGYSVAEIAEEFDRSERFVKRKLALIRSIWNSEIESQQSA